MPGRAYITSSGAYRYGFNGKENDNEVKGVGDQQDYGMRIYDPRLGRFLSTDPLFRSFAYYSTYQFAGNKPLWAIDIDGLEEFKITGSTMKITAVIGVVTSKDPIVENSKTNSSAQGKLNIDLVNADIKKAYPTTEITLSDKEAKAYGFEVNKDKKYTIEFDIKVKELDGGETSGNFKKQSVKNSNVLYLSNSVDDKEHSPAQQVHPDIELNTDVYKEGTYQQQDEKAAKMSGEKDASPGKVIGHEFGHWLRHKGNAGHEDDGILDTKNTKVSPSDVNKILQQNKKEIQKQNKKTKK